MQICWFQDNNQAWQFQETACIKTISLHCISVNRNRTTIWSPDWFALEMLQVVDSVRTMMAAQHADNMMPKAPLC